MRKYELGKTIVTGNIHIFFILTMAILGGFSVLSGGALAAGACYTSGGHPVGADVVVSSYEVWSGDCDFNSVTVNSVGTISTAGNDSSLNVTQYVNVAGAIVAGANRLNVSAQNLTVISGGKISADGSDEQNGGTITVNASSVDISGTISAVGGNAQTSCGAGKSGGRITINASTINHSASGVVSAIGGTPYCYWKNGGNGGTVSITTPNPFSPAGTITAAGGIANPSYYPSGANGIIYLDFGGDRMSDSIDLYISNPAINPIPWLVDSMNGGCSDNTSCVIYGVKTNLYGTRSFESLNATNSEVHIKSTPTLSVPGILLVDSSSTVYIETNSLNISAPSILIGAGSTLQAGGNSLNIATPNLTVRTSGKLSADGSNEQNGGTITVNASLVDISGTISAVGGNAQTSCGAGKSGGRITINASTINHSASGVVSAIGGTPYCYWKNGGNGGTVTITTPNPFSPAGTITAAGGIANPSYYPSGANGVIYLDFGGDRMSDSVDLYTNNPTFNPSPWLVDSMNGGCSDSTSCVIYGVKTNLYGNRSFESLNATKSEVHIKSTPTLSVPGILLVDSSSTVYIETNSLNISAPSILIGTGSTLLQTGANPLNIATQNLTVRTGGKISADGGSEQNGGTITVNASSVDISGTISAIGGNAQTSCSAGKSGGRITINASTINHSATGVVSAIGGTPYCSWKNGGNGGTVSITTPNPFSPAGTVTAAGGIANPPSYPSGANGMIYLDFGGDRMSDSVDLYTNNPTFNPSPWLVDSMNGGCSDNTSCVIYGVKTNLYGNRSFESLNATKSEVHIKSTPTLSVPGILLFDSSSTVYVDTNSLNISAPSILIGTGATLQAGANSLNIATPNLTVRTSGKLSADGGSEQNGGILTINASSVDISGTISTIGGIGCNGKNGGTLTFNAGNINLSAAGVISANGGNAGCYFNTAGSGGAVYINTVDQFMPSGSITAVAGSGYYAGGSGVIYLNSGGDRVSDSLDIYGNNPTINPVPWLVDSMNGGCSDNTSCVIYGVKTNLYGNRSFESLNATKSEVHIKSTPTLSVPGILLFDSSSTVYVDTNSLNISAPSILVGAGSTLQAGANSLNIATPNLTVRASGKLSADGGSEQNGGTLTINASSVDISGAISTVGGIGCNGKNGGTLTFNAGNINLSAAGVISANGGNAGCYFNTAGSGGAVYINTVDQFMPSGSITAVAGSGYYAGGSGVIYLDFGGDRISDSVDLYTNNPTINPSPWLVDSMSGGCSDNTSCVIYGVKTNLYGNRSFESLNATKSEVHIKSTPTLSVPGILLVDSSSTVYVDTNSLNISAPSILIGTGSTLQTGTNPLNIATPNLTVRTSGKISADGGSEQNGGTITVNASSVDISGTISAVGGNGQNSCSAGKSGGRITINGSTINHSASGVVSANGGSPYCSLRNGGNGGTVTITVINPYSPTGTITATGGIANPPSYPSGANGTITIYYCTTCDISGATINPAPILIHFNCEDIRDDIPPTTTINLSGTPGTNDWYTSNVSVTLTATDNEGGTGVNYTEYSLDGTNWSRYTGTPFPIADEGITTIYYRSADKADNIEATKNQTIKIDKTPPNITVNVPANGSVYILNQTLIADWSATDSVSGIYSATGTTPNGSAIYTGTAGANTFNVTATDNASNTGIEFANFTVTYNFLGIQPPIESNGSSIFKLGSTVPVKFKLSDANGNNVSTANASLTYQFDNATILGNVSEAESTSAADNGNFFRYDSTENQYIFNLGTKNMSTGTYSLTIHLDDGTEQMVYISLEERP